MNKPLTATDIIGATEAAFGKTLRAHLEISDRCNETCLHCYQVQGQKGELSTAELERVMDDLADNGVLLLTISGGESTLRADLFELLEYARKKGFAVRLFTNGLTMTEAMAQRLKALAVQAVEISLYSHRAEVHDLVTGVPGSFERSVAGIKHLVAAGVRVIGKTPVMSFNEDEAMQFIGFVRSLGAAGTIDDHDLMPREGGDRAPTAFNLSREARRRLLDALDAQEPTLVRDGRQGKKLDAGLCGVGDGIHMESNGELRPCTMLEVPVGHAVRDGIGTARSSNANLKALKALRWRDVHGCRDCDLQGYCTRCFAAARADTGDALAPYASACANARFNYETFLGVAPRVQPGEAGLDPALGPYRELEPGLFVPIEDRLTEADLGLRRELGWILREGGPAPSPQPARPGQLVQLRRPGHKREKAVKMPVPAKNRGAAIESAPARGTVGVPGHAPGLMEGLE